MRRRNYWRGIDSLYHAWLLKNFDEIQPGFDLVRFEATYPSYLEYGDLDVTVEGLDAIRQGMSFAKSQAIEEVPEPLKMVAPAPPKPPNADEDDDDDDYETGKASLIVAFLHHDIYSWVT